MSVTASTLGEEGMGDDGGDGPDVSEEFVWLPLIVLESASESASTAAWVSVRALESIPWR